MLATVLPKPVLFHPLKHHIGYVRAFIHEQTIHSAAGIGTALRSIGQSQLDFYTGSMLPLQVAQEVILHLQQHNILAPEAFYSYLISGGEHYQTIMLSDGTDWVLRWGVVAERYVHLHPARYAAQTIRVKAVSLKTAIAAIVAAAQTNYSIDLKLVNKVRTEWLQLPPLTVLTPAEGAGKLITLLQQP
ncbi:hypothetical protein GXP69_17395 [Pontibacter sp. BT327]|uniref:Uncharacterized protein n=1 Tax=Pontibacter burrus TaxID=2704466 RepID=A0A6B3LX05_9BACT|nr:hypothetical protein [Pontibacter burrus]